MMSRPSGEALVLLADLLVTLVRVDSTVFLLRVSIYTVAEQ